MKHIITLLILFISGNQLHAQQILTNEKPRDASENAGPKKTDDTFSQPVNSIVLVSTINGVSTYAIVNDKIKYELFYNQEKRDAITALPGFVELGLSLDNTPMRVVIESSYATEYINKYFTSKINLPTNK